ncbi:LOB domain-containing protein 22-like [Tripterygium wilfordii]|uniref:LOB domain-containing protein 22-like n=1 Tax=Tripterygium wilfordii TaxID=458696 RepID=A0A7J7DY08_TRIWF|nr:LOB domain-containing protein 22-like [Tripterygium wilfordii]KAF5751268.1 LOB domain-containing protein 22-like [Tripterygium wilfordii]
MRSNINIPPRIGNGTTQACAACKYQRRKCAPDCILAPYFPHDRQTQFLNAHKLFGVSNITKCIKDLDPPQKVEAMKTIIFQSDVRANDPVGGCYRIICELQRQIEYNKAELELVLHQLAVCHAQAQQRQQQQSINMNLNANATSESNDSMRGCHEMVSNNNNAVDPLNMQYYYLQSYQDPQTQQQLQDQEAMGLWTTALQDSSLSTSSSSLGVKQSFVNECDDMKPVLGVQLERHDVKFEPEEPVERRFAPSTQLLSI